MTFDFGEKKQERNRNGEMVDVWVLPKYRQSREKAIKTIEKYEDITEADFWILKNETKNGKIMYSGLIMSHNGCLKLNEYLTEADSFKPECVTVDKDGYNGSLVYTYCCPEQGIYEVGEASAHNCKNAYPYAMAFKRCYDRVVLKASKLAFDGIYSESESDAFKEPESASEPKIERPASESSKKIVKELCKLHGRNLAEVMVKAGWREGEEVTEKHIGVAKKILEGIK